MKVPADPCCFGSDKQAWEALKVQLNGQELSTVVRNNLPRELV